MFWLVFISAIVVLICALYRSLQNAKLKGVKYVPLFEKAWDFRPFFFDEKIIALYNKFPNDRYTGIYQTLRPLLMIKDLDLIRTIMVKDFEHFTDHTPIIPENDHDPLWGKNLFALQGQKWRSMRSTLSPAYTSSKMKAMFQLMTACSEQFTQHFEKMNTDAKDVDLKDVFTRYSTDIIGTCAFGIQTDSLAEKENAFFMMGQEVGKLRSFWTMFKLAVGASIPSISKIMKIKLFGPKLYEFFPKLVSDTMAMREEKNIYRPDMIQLMMEAQKGKLKYEDDQNSTGFAAVSESNALIPKEQIKQNFTLMEMTAQVFIFFIGGFDSISTMMSFMAYELALATDVQEKLYEEVEKTLEECNGTISYDDLNKMKYMDMVTSETLRKYPMGFITDRLCTKNYTIPPAREHETEVEIKVGDTVIIPIWAIHYNPEYFPDPRRFDPERFSDENKVKIKPFTYIPFGAGPRNCIGSRFALLEAKAMFTHLLHKFRIVPNKNTPIPLTVRRDSFPVTPQEQVLVDLIKRV